MGLPSPSPSPLEACILRCPKASVSARLSWDSLAPLPYSRQPPPFPRPRSEDLRRSGGCANTPRLPPSGFLPPSTVHAALSPPGSVAARWPDTRFTVLRCRGLRASRRSDRVRRHMAFPTVQVPFEDFPSLTADHASRRATTLLSLPTSRPAEAALQVAHRLPTSRHRAEAPSPPHRASIGPDASGLSQHFLWDQPVGLHRRPVPKHPTTPQLSSPSPAPPRHAASLSPGRRHLRRRFPRTGVRASSHPHVFRFPRCDPERDRGRLPARRPLRRPAWWTSRSLPHSLLRSSPHSRGAFPPRAAAPSERLSAPLADPS